MCGYRCIEVWSPLKWIGVRFYVGDDGIWYVRKGCQPRRALHNKAPDREG